MFRVVSQEKFARRTLIEETFARETGKIRNFVSRNI